MRKRTGLAVFGSNMLSSAAYAPDEILLALSLSGLLAASLAPLIGAAVAVVILVIVLCTGFNIRAYPGSGGDYEVADDNLGRRAGLVAAASLLVDFVLTVAVSLSVFAAYLGAVIPALADRPIVVALAGAALVAFLGVRGARGSRSLLAWPTYLFLIAVAATLVWGTVRILAGDPPQAVTADYAIEPLGGAHSGLLSLGAALLLLRAFSSGSVALAGVSAITTAAPRFRAPQGRSAALVLGVTGLCAAVMLVGVTWLASQSGVAFVVDPHAQLRTPDGSPVGADYAQQPVLSQLAHAVFAGAPALAVAVVLVTAGVLLVAANSAVEGFPKLASRLAAADFLPRALQTVGSRLTHTNGILALTGSAVVLIVAFGASPAALIELYLVGVFTSFVLGQLGMVRRWSAEIRRVPSGAHRRRLMVRRAISATGFAISCVILLVAVVARYATGAWLTIALIAVLALCMGAIRRHYERVGRELAAGDEDDASDVPPNVRAVVVVTEVHRPALRALAFARASRPSSVEALAVGVDPEQTAALERAWDAQGIRTPLTVLDSPYRDVCGPILEHVEEMHRRAPRDLIVVYIPRYIVGRWFEQFLHNQTILRLTRRLVAVPNVVIGVVPWRLRSYHRALEADIRHSGVRPRSAGGSDAG